MTNKEMKQRKGQDHGGNLRDFAERFELKQNEIIDFSSNVNPLSIPSSVRQIYFESTDELFRYPDPDADALRKEITRHFPVHISNILPGNGAVSLMGLAIRALTPRRTLIVEPCFTEYRRLLELQGAEVISIRLENTDDFAFPFLEIREALPSVDILILGHPNSPTGTALKRVELFELLAFAKQCGVFVIVDEAFIDWCPEISVATALNENSNFIVIRSLTKFYGLAGIRAAFALGPSEIIENMRNHQDTWSVNALAQKLSVAMLQETNFVKKTREWFSKEPRWFYQELQTLKDFRVFPSRANFFLIKCLAGDSRKLFEFLGYRKIYIRLMEDHPSLGGSYFRAAVRLRHENEEFIKNLREYASQ